MSNRYYERYLFFALTVEGAVISIYYRICFYFAKKKFCCCYSYNSGKVLEFESILLVGTMYIIGIYRNAAAIIEHFLKERFYKKFRISAVR